MELPGPSSNYLERELYERIRAEPDLFEFLQQGSLDGIWYWDLENRDHEWMSARFWEVLGYDPREKAHLASEWQAVIFPEDLELALANLEAHLADPAHAYDQIVRYRHKDGSTIWVRCRGTAIRDAEGRAIRMLGAHNDVTALKRAEEELRRHTGQLERAYRMLREQADTIRADLVRAGIIQRALLPRVAPTLGDFHVHAVYRPSQNVGGDLYDVVRIDEGRAGLLVADAAGHGLGAAMLAVLFRSQLPCVSPESRAPLGPREVLAAANRSLCEALPARGLFLTAAYALVETRSGRAVIASAGHPPLLLLRRGGGVERIFHTGPALGLSRDADFAEQEIALAPGDRLFFYSDGLYQGLSDVGASADEAMVAALQDETAAGVDLLRRLLPRSRGSQKQTDDVQEDDVTLLMLTAAPGVSVLDNGSIPPLARPRLPRESTVFHGEEPGRVTLCVRGRGDWTRSAVFYGECAAAVEAGRDVLVDLTLCHHLDSTFLGTIHLLCDLADRVDVEFRLQGVLPSVEALFTELGMEAVRDHIVACRLPLPSQMKPLGDASTDHSFEALLLLRAHEKLAALSDRNREEFDPILTLLRREVPPTP